MNRRHLSDLRGVMRLAVEATIGVTSIVERMHHTIQLRHPPIGKSRAGQTGGLTGFVYNSIRATTRLVGQGLDAGMNPLTTLLPEYETSATRDRFVAIINGIYGDHLVQTGNPLAVDMQFRHAGKTVEPERPFAGSGHAEQAALTGKILLFVHGLCLNDGHWNRDGHDHGNALATGLGYTPLYLRYNTGLPVAKNGQVLTAMLENLLQNWPRAVVELVIIGHSMGGLVARSACHHGGLAGHGWLRNLRKLFFIGTPHHGAPLERGGNWLDGVMGLSPYVAPFTRIGRKRSAGITDLRHGSITGRGRDFVALPVDVECYAMAATRGKKGSRISERLIGDGLVPLDSALGRHKDPARTLDIPGNHQWVGYDMGHIELLRSRGVFAQLRDWLE